MDYFNDITHIAPIKDIINSDFDIYAHLHGLDKESLEKHGELTVDYCKKLMKAKGLDSCFKRMEELIVPKKYLKLWRQMLLDAIYLHDVGKSNLAFQALKMKNVLSSNYENNSNHSSVSALVYISVYLDTIEAIEDDSDYNIMLYYLYLNAYLISKHHSGLYSKFMDYNRIYEDILSWVNGPLKLNLSSIDTKYIKKLEVLKMLDINILKEQFNILNNVVTSFKTDISYVIYEYSRLLYSILVTSDFYATSHFMSGVPIVDFGIFDNEGKIKERELFEDTKIVKGVRSYSQNRITDYKNVTNINQLRSEAFLNSEEKLLKNLDKNIFYLEAPTGCGKTYMSVNLAITLLEKCEDLNKIFYVFPYNNIAEQVKSDLDEMKLYNVMVNSTAPVETPNDDEDDDKLYLDRQFLHYKCTVMSHVKLFDILFGVKKNSAFSLAHLANSVVVLDEIQSYKNKIWRQMIEFLDTISVIYNIKFIIMSATLPRLDDLLDIKVGNYVNLIDNRDELFNNEYFKGRVTPNFELLEYSKDIIKEKIKERIKEDLTDGKKVLVEFIKRKSAKDFFNELVMELGKDKVRLMTSEDSAIEKQKIIKEIKGTKKTGLILIATQVIEAGVDISMDVGYMNISLLENMEQFMGRVNRNREAENAIVHFFLLDDVKDVYRDDNRQNFLVTTPKYKSIFKNRDLKEYFVDLFEHMGIRYNSKNEDNIKTFNNKVSSLDFFEIDKEMTLIDEKDDIQIFINSNIEGVSGEETWNNFVDTLKDKNLSYSSKQIKLINLNREMSYFKYTIAHWDAKNIDFNRFDNVCGIYYIDEDSCIVNGKFNLDKFIETYKVPIVFL